MATTGCTVCHQGLGGSTSFNDASHYPSNPKQRQEWEEKYHWHEPHMWDYPMLPTNMTEASCEQCHRQEVYVPNAPKLNVAYATYERAGCYACHKTRGFENLRKPGPILTKISGKLTQDWVKNWVRDPSAIKNVTWMPKVWYNSNSNSPADHPRNEAEINAAVAYLFANSETYTPAVASPPKGNPQAGEQIVRSVGCLGCHIIDENDRAAVGPRRTFGQPLKSVGSKTTYAWLYNWVRDPKHYNPGTYMPDLRLTDPQVADVATYLTTLTGSTGTAAPVQPTQAQTDAVLLDYLRNLMPLAEAQGRLAKMDANAKQLDLGQRVIARYGCFSCHDIKGFETTQPIGVDLSEEGSKLVTRLDFAFVRHRALEARLVPSEAEGSALVRSGARPGAARKAANARLPLQRSRERAPADGDHELPARRAAGVRAAAENGEARLHGPWAARWSAGRTASAATRSKEMAATTERS